MMTFIETTKRYGGLMIVMAIIFYVTALVALQLLAAAVEGFPKLRKDPPEPPVFTPEDGCMIVGQLEYCPIGSDIPPAKSPSHQEISAVKAYDRIRLLPPLKGKKKRRNPYGETRYEPAKDAVKGIKLVSHVLQVKKPIHVYAATFEDGPSAYARDLGKVSEIVYSKELYNRLVQGDVTPHSIIGLWGHEVGHVKYRENYIVDDRFENEASAEYFAGASIFRLGGAFSDAQNYTSVFNGEDDKHPPHAVGRLLSFEGWRQAKARYEDPNNKCRAGLVGETFDYKNRVCRAAITCLNENRPVEIACQKPNGSWSWL